MYTTIISVEELTASLTGKCVVIDCRFSLLDPDAGYQAYNTGHIPNAFYLHLDNDLSSPITPSSGRHPLPDLDKFRNCLYSMGVTKETQVVVYDDCAGAMAARAWWLISCLGHKAVAVLDGGFPAWQAAGGPESSMSATYLDELDASTCDFSSDDLSGDSLSTSQVKGLIKEGAICLIDARGAERFRGEVEPIDPIAGHIPGAVNRPLTDNIVNGFFKPTDRLRDEWLDLVESENIKEVVHMCGSGITACHNLLAMRIAGLDGGKVYAGSWSEWIRDPKCDIATDE